MSNEKKKVTSLAEVTLDVDKDFKKDELNKILNSHPKGSWVKEHPYIKGHLYIPIDKIEYMLKFIFREYRIEILREGMIADSVFCVVRVHYLNPVTQEWSYHDGVGAVELQTKKDSGKLMPDFSNLNRGAIPMSLPNAKSVAIKDACDHLGRAFGADLNRKDLTAFETDSSTQDAMEDRVRMLAEECMTVEELEKVVTTVPDKFKHIIRERAIEIEQEA